MSEQKGQWVKPALLGVGIVGLGAILLSGGSAKADPGGYDDTVKGKRCKKIDAATGTPSQFAAKWNGGKSNTWKELQSENLELKPVKIPYKKQSDGTTKQWGTIAEFAAEVGDGILPDGYWDSLGPWVIGQVVCLPPGWVG